MSIEKIKCPHCGAEYLPSEIFLSEDFLEKSKWISKDAQGKIYDFKADEAELQEEYHCDYCDNRFIVNAKIFYSAEKDDFDEEFAVKID